MAYNFLSKVAAEFTPFPAQPLLELPANIIHRNLQGLPAQCVNSGNDERVINSSIVLNVMGQTDEITHSDYEAISDAFMNAYNELGSTRCFQISDLTLDTKPEESTGITKTIEQRRRLGGSLGGSLTVKFNFALFYKMIGSCIGCPIGANLLYNDGYRRRLSQELSSEEVDKLQPFSEKAENFRALQQSNNGPTSIEFQERMTQILSANSPSTIIGVSDVSELETYSCSEQIDTIDTAIGLKLLGNYDDLFDTTTSDTSPEIEIMEHIVRNAYNSVNMANSETCDEEFRRVADVTFANAEHLSGNEFIMIFNISYKCRDCASSSTRTLFDDNISGKTLNRTKYYFDIRDPGPNEPPCVCAIGAHSFRGPTALEFSVAVHQAILSRKQHSLLNFVEDIDESQNDRSYETDAVTNLPAQTPTNPQGVQGDPIILGLKGQVFKFDGRDGGWYANIASKSLHWNMQFRKYPTCQEGSDVFVSGLTFITSKESDMQHQISESNILIATTPDPIPECLEYNKTCLGDGTLHISFDGGETYVSEPGDYHYGSRNRIVAHNTFAACSRRWYDYDITPKQSSLMKPGRRRVTIQEKKPLDLLLEKNETMIHPKECIEWIDDRKNKHDLFQQKGLWSSLHLQTHSVSFHIEYRQSNPNTPIEEQCKFQSLDAWMTTIPKELDQQTWQGILGETKKRKYNKQGQQILSDRHLLLWGNEDIDYEVDGPFGIHFNASKKNNIMPSLW